MVRVSTSVTDSDIAAISEGLDPGRVVLLSKLYVRYQTVARRSGRKPASPMTLSKALGRAGWERTLVRKSRGPRGNQTYTADTARIVPGGVALVNNPDEQMTTALRDLLDGHNTAFILSESIPKAYLDACHRLGQTPALSAAQVTKWLNRNGFVEGISGGKRGRGGYPGTAKRFVDIVTVNMIAPPKDWTPPKPKAINPPRIPAAVPVPDDPDDPYTDFSEPETEVRMVPVLPYDDRPFEGDDDPDDPYTSGYGL
jgi:hypothetical protein